jgi:hypothetical protein
VSRSQRHIRIEMDREVVVVPFDPLSACRHADARAAFNRRCGKGATQIGGHHKPVRLHVQRAGYLWRQLGLCLPRPLCIE